MNFQVSCHFLVSDIIPSQVNCMQGLWVDAVCTNVEVRTPGFDMTDRKPLMLVLKSQRV